MIQLLVLVYLAYRNSVLAKEKALNGLPWAFYTVIAYFLGLFLGVFVVIFAFCKDSINLNQLSATDPKTREAATAQMVDAFSANQLNMLTVILFGIGGYLLVRYILDRKPGKKEPEIHWMDKMGSNDTM